MSDHVEPPTRYDFFTDAFSNCYCGTEAKPDGAYIEYVHYAALLADYDRVVSLCVRQDPDTNQWYQFSSPYTPHPTREAAIAALLKGSE